jgi:hypothetical protein
MCGTAALPTYEQVTPGVNFIFPVIPVWVTGFREVGGVPRRAAPTQDRREVDWGRMGRRTRRLLFRSPLGSAMPVFAFVFIGALSSTFRPPPR